MARKRTTNDDWGMSSDFGQSASNAWGADNQVGTSGFSDNDWSLPAGKSASTSDTGANGGGIDWNLSSGSAPQGGGFDWEPSGGSSSGSSGSGSRDSSKFLLAFLVLAGVVVALALVFFIAGQAQYIDGRVTVVQTQQDGNFKLTLSGRIEGLDARNAYIAGFMMSPEGQYPEAVTEPVFITGVTSYQLAGDIIVQREGSYQLLMYYYPLTDASVRTTRPQALQLRYTSTPQVTPDPGRTQWYDASTPTPSPSPTPTPTATITVTPTPSPSPTPRERVTPRVGDVPTVVPATPTPSPTPLSTEPEAALFDTYQIGTRYFYHQMTANEKRLFSEVYDAIASFAPVVQFEGNYNKEELKRVMFVIDYDCPELLYTASEDGWKYVYYTTSADKVTKVEFTYTMSKTEFDRTFSQMMDKIRSMRSQPGFGSSDFSKQAVIYKYLIQHNYYDKVKPFCAMANSAWLLGYSKCSGYTRALNLALRYYGIQCCEIWGNTYDNGVIAPESHLWTGVKLDGQWYHCDATWDDPIVADNPNYDPYANSVAILPYLNLNDERMMRARSLHPNVLFDVPDCWSTRYNYYQTIGALIPAGSDAKTSVHNALTKAYQNGDHFFVMSFESTRDYTTVMASLVDYLKSWRYGSTRYNGCSWRYWAESNLLYVFNIGFR